jgi:Phage integrase, N-terminal SAM-like domain
VPRRPGVQIIRSSRKDASITFGLRVRAAGADEVVPLGNSNDGWDEARVEVARRQLLAKLELGLWTPGRGHPASDSDEEPTFRELATQWLEDRRRNPAIRPATIELNQTQLTRYLLPFFGDLLPSQITPQQIKQYRRGIHEENEQIRAAADGGKPLRNPRTGLRIRTLGNESINKTLLVLAQVLDEAEDATWIDRNPARRRRMREPAERKRRGGQGQRDARRQRAAADPHPRHPAHLPADLHHVHAGRRPRHSLRAVAGRTCQPDDHACRLRSSSAGPIATGSARSSTRSSRRRSTPSTPRQPRHRRPGYSSRI